MSTSQKRIKAAEDAGYRRAVQDLNLKLFGSYDVDFAAFVKRIQEQRNAGETQAGLQGFAAACAATKAPEAVLSLIRGCDSLNAAENVWRAFQLGREGIQARPSPAPTTGIMFTDATTEPAATPPRAPSPPIHGVVLTEDERRWATSGDFSQKIMAIKSVRNRTSLGLKEAKECVDAAV